jgi:DNA-directed RNA polymerase specialized sigma24 family protein
MERPSSYEITQLLRAWSSGDQMAFEKLVHNELHKLAGYHMRKKRPGHILQTTPLVQEVYIRLMRWQDVSWHDRANFFGVVSMLMRRVLVGP